MSKDLFKFKKDKQYMRKAVLSKSATSRSTKAPIAEYQVIANSNASKTRTKLVNNTLLNLLLQSMPETISDDDITLITKDLTFTQCDVSRKAVTEKKTLAIICDDEDIKMTFESYFNADIISQILETYLYGLNVFEVNWKQKERFVYPILIQRDFRNFKFVTSGELVYKGDGAEVEIPEYKVIYALNRANFSKRYGDALFKKLYFPIKLKNASLRFWAEFLEKFGSPWTIAKTDSEVDQMAEQVYDMLNGDTAVIAPEEEIELIQPSKDAGFEKIIDYCDNQISKVILGANLTSNVSEKGSYAASKTHNEIRSDLAANDEKILLFVLNRAVKFFKELNNIDMDISVKLFDKSPNSELASRDKILYDMGFKPTNNYIKENYNLDIDENYTPNLDVKISNKQLLKSDYFAFKAEKAKPKSIDKFDLAANDPALELGLAKSDKELEFALSDILKECNTYEEAFEKFAQLYDGYPLDTLEELMFKAIANVELIGYEE